ncbi:MAG: aminopeptidase P N-terminal domain-containing protein [Bacteroidetes bacterium]|jgi:Xaa-Pro aminopeptidase|nr:aminopeptidase P N-terminal domain-containing protein [Bacteroidota bacterium]
MLTRSLRSFVVVCSLALTLAEAQPMPSSYLEYDVDRLPPSVHRARRDSLMTLLGERSVVILAAGPVRVRNHDVDYQYRQDDNFWYLTGFPEPNAVLVLVPRGIQVADPADSTRRITVREVLFVEPRNPQRERWEGRRYGPEGAMSLRGFAYALSHDRMGAVLARVLMEGVEAVYCPTMRDEADEARAEVLRPVESMLERVRTRFERRDPTPTIQRMRAVKSSEEVALLRKATTISAVAHAEAMKSVQPGMREYELQAIYEYVYRRMGAEYAGYPCIVGAGENAVVLHYSTNRREIRSGDLVLADCGAEYRGYSSDITRTYPANGRFSRPQRAIYDIVLAANQAAIAAIKPGVAWRDVTAISDRTLEAGLVRIGLVKQTDGREFRKFVWHGLGHAVGLNVHDVGVDTLRANVVFTVEPGIYIAEDMEGIPPEYRSIGVRIEDVVLVTSGGNEVLSKGAPNEPAAIEALMRRSGIGNVPVE